MSSISIEPAITPSRIREVGKLALRKKYKISEVANLLSPGFIRSEYTDKIIKNAMALGIIGLMDEKVVNLWAEEEINNIDSFKRKLAAVLRDDTRFSKLLINVLSHQEYLFESNLDTMYTNLTVHKLIDENKHYWNGFRFWFEFLGYGFDLTRQTGKVQGIMVAPIKQLELCMEIIFEKRSEMGIKEFLENLLGTALEFADFYQDGKVMRPLSQSLIYLQNIKMIELSFQKDAYSFASLELDQFISNYSDIRWLKYES